MRRSAVVSLWLLILFGLLPARQKQTLAVLEF